MGTQKTQQKGFVQPLILTPINKQINIDELISKFEKDQNEYSQFPQKTCLTFNRFVL